MKNAPVNCPVCGNCFDAYQLDATADLQSQVEQLRVERYESVALISLGKTLNNNRKSQCEDLESKNDHLRTALEKCVVALESEPFHSWRVKEAINTAKPLLNKSSQNG